MNKKFLTSILFTSLILFGCNGGAGDDVIEENNTHEQIEEEPEVLFPETNDEWFLELQEETRNDPTRLEWFVTIQEETKDLNFELMGVDVYNSLNAVLEKESSGPELIFQIDMLREDYVSYALDSNGKAFNDEFFIKSLSEKYRNTLFELLDSEGYTIYSYENGKEGISVNDWAWD